MNKEDIDAVDILCKEMLKYIKKASKEKMTGDITFRTVVKKVDGEKYQILDVDGTSRMVKCCIPNVKLRVGQSVYVKKIQGKIKDMHICGIV